MSSGAPLDLDEFYSSCSIEELKFILGDDLFFHFGDFRRTTDFDTAMRQVVLNHYPNIPRNSRVLDCGCGWGTSAAMLTRDLGCTVLGLTISTSQRAYCRSRGIAAHRTDLDAETIEGRYDVALVIECMEHLRDKLRFLKMARNACDRLLLTVSCTNSPGSADVVLPRWSMLLSTREGLMELLGAAGWRVLALDERRKASLPTLIIWQERLEAHYGNRTPPEFLGRLRTLCDRALESAGAVERYCRLTSLLDVFAVAA